jgi:hypothetical protein
MIEIKVSNINESSSRLIVMSGQIEVLHLNIRRPIEELTYYQQVAPILAPIVRADDSFMYVGSERFRMTVEPITGFMSCGGRSTVEIIQEIQREGAQEGQEAWSPHHILLSAIDFEQKQDQILMEQRETLSSKNEDLLHEQEVRDREDEDRKLEKEIIGTKQYHKTMTPLEAARHRAAKTREGV